MRRLIICYYCIFSIYPALADDIVNIPQVSSKNPIANPQGNADLPAPADQGTTNTQDYQRAVLSNPIISDFGRANNLLNQAGSGANTAVVIQNGSSNNATVDQEGTANGSSIMQTGTDNSATQTQKGESNDLMLQQEGEYNSSTEQQTGGHNHKVIIQNGERYENTDDQGTSN